MLLKKAPLRVPPPAVFLMFLLFASAASAVYWDDPSAEAKVCFTLGTSSAVTVYDGSSFNSVFVVNTTHTSGFDPPYTGYISGTAFNVFKFTSNGSHDFWALPAMHASGNGVYCIYAGGETRESLSGIAKFHTDGTSYGSFTGSCASTDGVCYGNMNTSGSYSGGKEILASVNGTGRISSWYSTYYESQIMNRTASTWQYYNAGYKGMYTDADTSSMKIVRLLANGSTYPSLLSLYDGDFTPLNSSTPSTSLSTIFAMRGMGINWSIAYEKTSTITKSNESYSNQSAYITLNSPLTGGSYSPDEFTNILYSVYKPFDNCTTSLNGVSQGNIALPGIGENVVVNSSSIAAGVNEINVTCWSSGMPESKYAWLTVYSSNANTLFYDAFGQDISSCPSATLSSLSLACDEWYHNEYAYDFSAVVCYNLAAGNYSCILSFAANDTKNNYTIFTNPGWNIPTAGVDALNLQHIGANFVYNGITISNGMEIISNVSYVYIPSQTKLRDCGVYYSTTAHCSLWSGFTLNDRTVYVSNEKNEWFAATGYGVVNFDTNYSDSTVSVSVTPIGQYVQNQTVLAQTGIFTRIHCYENASTWYMQTRNTLPTLYTLSVTGTDSQTYTVTSTVFDYSVPVYNDTTVSLEANGRQLCYYGPSDRLFLPFSLPDIHTDFSDIFMKMIFVFAVVVSALIPYSLVITVILNDMFHLMSAQHLAMVVVFACISSLVNAAYTQSRGIKNIIILLGLTCGFLLALGTTMTQNNLPDSSPVTALFESFKTLAEAQTFTDMVAGLYTFAIQLFVTIVLLPIVAIGYMFDLVEFVNPNLAAALAPFSIIAVAAVIYLYIKAYEVLGNKFRDV